MSSVDEADRESFKKYSQLVHQLCDDKNNLNDLSEFVQLLKNILANLAIQQDSGNNQVNIQAVCSEAVSANQRLRELVSCIIMTI